MAGSGRTRSASGASAARRSPARPHRMATGCLPPSLPAPGNWRWTGSISPGGPCPIPSFEDSLRRARSLPLNRLRASPHAAPGRACRVGRPGAPPVPAGFVFHQSRCGSTLVSQMVAANPRNIVISEAAPIDSIVQLVAARTDVPVDQRVALLRAHHRRARPGSAGRGGHYVVKLDSWHTLALPLFRLALSRHALDFPLPRSGRDPRLAQAHGRRTDRRRRDALRSLWHRGCGRRCRRTNMPRCALGRTAEAVIEHLRLGGGMLVNYTELPDAMEARILPHFGIVPDDAGKRGRHGGGIGPRCQAHRLESFARDSGAKQQEAGGRSPRHRRAPYGRTLSPARRASPRRRKMSAIFGIVRFDGEPSIVTRARPDGQYPGPSRSRWPAHGRRSAGGHGALPAACEPGRLVRGAADPG